MRSRSWVRHMRIEKPPYLLPFRDAEVVAAAEKAIEPYAHLSLHDALVAIRKDREAKE